MAGIDNDEDLGRVLREGYGAPPPRDAFADGLLRRLRRELRAAEAAAPPDVRPAPAGRVLRLARVHWRGLAAAAVLVLAVGLALLLGGRNGDRPATGPDQPAPEAYGTPPNVKPDGAAPDKPGGAAAADGRVPLQVVLPRPPFGPTPRRVPPSPHLEPYADKHRPPFLVPEGTTNLARGRPVTSSDPDPVIGRPALVTDGDKEADDGCYVELGPGKQWVQIDLGRPAALYAIVVWHYFQEARVYHDVAVQTADDPDFVQGVHTVYNNDYDNSSGLGVGRDLEYFEDFRGRLLDARGVRARYVRLWSRGNTSNDMNHYTEVEVYGKP